MQKFEKSEHLLLKDFQEFVSVAKIVLKESVFFLQPYQKMALQSYI